MVFCQQEGGEPSVPGTGKKGNSTAYERGMAHLKRAEYPQALELFTEAIQSEPEAPDGYVGRALAYHSLGEKTPRFATRRRRG